MPAVAAFAPFARWAARASGHPAAFLIAAGTVIGWATTGRYFHYSDTWQLVINTGTTIVTFLMVFLIQNTQNHDTAAMHVKLDELIRAVNGAHNTLLNLEDLDEQELENLRKHYRALAAAAQSEVSRGRSDTGTPDGCPVPGAAARQGVPEGG